MELKDYILSSIAVLGWLWAITQFFINRRNQKNDIALEKRFEVYSSLLTKMDEINQSLRTDPNMMYGISSEFMSRLLKGNEEDRNQALVDMNTQVLEVIKKAVQSTLILNQELNKLKLVCSDALLPKIEEYKRLAKDSTDEIQIVLNRISPKDDIEITGKELQNLGYRERTERMTVLWHEIETSMRDEIGYYKK